MSPPQPKNHHQQSKSQGTLANGNLASSARGTSSSSSSSGITVAFDNARHADRWMKSSAATLLLRRCMASYKWDETLARRVIAEYAKFCCLKARMGDFNTQAMVPPDLILNMWHAHYLDSMSYIVDIKAICGSDQTYLHYNQYALFDPTTMSQRVASTKIAVRALFATDIDVAVSDIDVAVWKYQTNADSRKVTAGAARSAAITTARAHTGASRPSTNVSSRQGSIQATAMKPNPSTSSVDVDEIASIPSTCANSLKDEDEDNEEDDSDDDDGEEETLEEDTVGTIEDAETEKEVSSEESSPEPVAKRTRRPSPPTKSGTTRKPKTTPKRGTTKRRAATSTKKRGGGTTAKRRKSTGGGTTAKRRKSTTSSPRRKKKNAPKVEAAPAVNPTVGVSAKPKDIIDPTVDKPTAPVPAPAPAPAPRMTIAIKDVSLFVYKTFNCYCDDRKLQYLSYTTPVLSFPLQLQWQNKKSTFKVPPSTTVASLKAHYAKHEHMDELTTSLLVFLHASIPVQDEEVVSSIPFRGECDFLEATVELEPYDGELFGGGGDLGEEV
eukprot:CAMPEP_0178720930 /NCGR_PEP_ID=MMETSP0699-20121125/24020_1 /TAXON_ID=265572 /ORGANISM="Extubocellulus spinifer, Strain CCMP396" /LENGTH=552 /DNA_ID=CAMNT_0020371465 /DNA_START=239 /DNA_END=1899 /DNA_ORIENTATION=+